MSALIICCSGRAKSESSRLSNYVRKCMEDSGQTGEILDLSEIELPIWNGDIWTTGKNPTMESAWRQISNRLEAASSYAMIVPEWNGAAPCHVLNFLTYVGSEMAHKPTLLFAVSSASGGSSVINMMRSFGYKNTRFLLLPEHIIIRNVKDLKFDLAPSSTPNKTLERIAHALRMLLVYEKHCASIRLDLGEEKDRYKYGM